MKKLLSMMLVMLMVVSVCAPASLIVSAETSDDSLIFSLSFSQDDSDITFADAAANGTAAKFTPEAKATLSLGTVEGKTTRYLQTTQDKNSGVYVRDDDIDAAMKDEISIELWTKSPESVSYRMGFTYWGYIDTSNTASYNMAFQYDSASVITAFSGNHTTHSVANPTRVATVGNLATESAWNHWVITREYDSAGTGGKYGSMKVYKNGEPVGSSDISAELKELISTNRLYIGYAYSGAKGCGAAYGAFNVYNTILSATDVKAKYDASYTNYYDADIDDGGEGGEEGGDDNTGDTPDVELDTTGLVFDMDLSDSTASSVAVKDGTADAVVEDVKVLAGGVTVGTTSQGTKYLQSTYDTKNSGVSVDDSAVKAAFASDVTVEMWSKAPTGVSTYVGPFGYTDKTKSSNQYNMLFQYSASSSNVLIETREGAAKLATISNNSVDLTPWTHWVVTRTYDSETSTGTMTVYRNGDVFGTAPINGELTDISANGLLTIGQMANNAKGSGASIGSFKVYNRVLTPSEIADKFDATVENYYTLDKTGLVFNMDLSDSTESSVVVKDSTADLVEEAFTMGSSNAIGTIAATGKKYLDVYDGLAVKDSAVNNASNNNLTVEYWAQADAATPTGWVFSLRSTAGKYALKGMPVFANSVDYRYDIEYSLGMATPYIPTTEGIIYTDWNHYVITRTNNGSDGGEANVYVNGKLVDTKEIDGAVSASEFLNIGIAYSGASSTTKFAGNIGSFKVYNRALAENEIVSAYKREAADYGIEIIPDITIDGDIIWTTDAGVEVTAINSNLTSLNAALTLRNNTESGIPVLCIVAYYDGEGNLTAYDGNTEGVLVPAGETLDFTFDLGTISPEAGCKTKVLVWKITNLTPYTDGSGIEYSSQGL